MTERQGNSIKPVTRKELVWKIFSLTLTLVVLVVLVVVPFEPLWFNAIMAGLWIGLGVAETLTLIRDVGRYRARRAA